MRDDQTIDTNLESKLATLVFDPDIDPTIEIAGEHCPSCEGRPCNLVCPAGLYSWDESQMTYLWEKCLECGACRVICPYDAIRWRYPRDGRGVRYRWG